jgi:molybdenum cofactor synthesis domain-containing protein
VTSVAVAVVTISDSRTPENDEGGGAVVEGLEGAGHKVVSRRFVKDDREAIREAVRASADDGAEVVVTTGGTGIAPRDVTVEAVLGMLDKRLDGFSDETLARLSAYAWPGNVRELENVIERATVLCTGDRIDVGHLPPHLGAVRLSGGIAIPGSTLDEIERYAIVKALEVTGGSTGKAAELLGISVRKIQYKMHEYQMAPKSGVGVVAVESAAGKS